MGAFVGGVVLGIITCGAVVAVISLAFYDTTPDRTEFWCGLVAGVVLAGCFTVALTAASR